MKILAVYDGTLNSKDALRKGIEKAKQNGAELLVLQVFNSSMFIDYEITPGETEFIKKEAAGYLEEAKVILKEEAQGLRTGLFTGEGDPGEQITQLAAAKNVDLLLCPAAYGSIVKQYIKMPVTRGKQGEETAVIIGPKKLAATEGAIKSV
jgi:nucleotide-binding universal stress UspA family protein